MIYLVYEGYRGAARRGLRRRGLVEQVAQRLDLRADGVYLEQLAARDLRHEPHERRLADAGRAVEYAARHLAAFEHEAQRPAAAQYVALPRIFVERRGPHALGERNLEAQRLRLAEEASFRHGYIFLRSR